MRCNVGYGIVVEVEAFEAFEMLEVVRWYSLDLVSNQGQCFDVVEMDEGRGKLRQADVTAGDL